MTFFHQKGDCIIIPRSTIAPSGNIGMGQIHLSLHICHDGWLDFHHIWYHDQVPCAANAHKTEFSSVSNLSNYGNFFIHFFSVCCDISEKNVEILFVQCIWWFCSYNVFGKVIRYHAYSYNIIFVAVLTLSNYGHFFIIYVSLVISQRRMGWFYLYLVQ